MRALVELKIGECACVFYVRLRIRGEMDVESRRWFDFKTRECMHAQWADGG